MFKLKRVLLIVSITIVLLVILLSSEALVLFARSFMTSSTVNNDSVVLHADKKGHFFGHLTINGVTLNYIVDSGATNVTLNSHDANKAKLDYAAGELITLTTPGGEVQAFSLKVDVLVIGTIVLDDVRVTVIEGGFPPYVLLGISAQNKLDVKRDNALMTLGRKY